MNTRLACVPGAAPRCETASAFNSIQFEGAGHLLKRAQGDLLLIHRSDGRMLVIDVGYGEVVSDFVL